MDEVGHPIRIFIREKSDTFSSADTVSVPDIFVSQLLAQSCKCSPNSKKELNNAAITTLKLQPRKQDWPSHSGRMHSKIFRLFS